MSEAKAGTCMDCGRDLSRTVGPGAVWYEVKGFEQPRSGGGTNAIAARERTGNLVCGGCIHRRKSGLAPGQQRLA